MHRLVKSSGAEQLPVPTLLEPETESRMPSKILILYGSYRRDRAGIRFAKYLVRRFEERGDMATLVDAKSVGLPILDRMYKEYPPGEAPSAMEALAKEIRSADAFVFVTGEYNWGVQPGLKNLTDHFLEEWFWRPAAIASYSAGRFSGMACASATNCIILLAMSEPSADRDAAPASLPTTLRRIQRGLAPSSRLLTTFFPAPQARWRRGRLSHPNAHLLRSIRLSG
jgi:NAD(P)H-dependent FMN reductase